MKKWVFALSLVVALSFSGTILAQEWATVTGVPNTSWMMPEDSYIRDDAGTLIEGKLVVVLIKAPVTQETVAKMVAAQQDPQGKEAFKQITHQVRRYIFSLDNGLVSSTGMFWVDKDGAVLTEYIYVSEFIQVPEKAPAVFTVYKQLKQNEAAGLIK